MFDDPREDLSWLQQELLEAEQAEAPFQPASDLWDPDDPEQQWLDEVEALLGQEEPAPAKEVRRPVKSKKSPRPTAAQRAARSQEEPWDESAAVFDDKAPPKGIGGLVVLAILEVLGILAVVGWWLKWLSL